MLTIQENQLPGPLKSSDIKIPTTVVTKLKLLMEYKQEEKNKAESQGNSDMRSILNELQEFKMNLNELKTLNELQEIKTDLKELKTQLYELQENKKQENSELRSTVNSVLRSINELKVFQSNQKAQGNSVMRSMLNDFKNELKMDLTELKTQGAKQQLTLSNTNKDTTPPKK